MEQIFISVAVGAFIIMMLSLLWPKKKQRKKIEPTIIPVPRPQIKQPVMMPEATENLDEQRQLARQLFTTLRDK